MKIPLPSVLHSNTKISWVFTMLFAMLLDLPVVLLPIQLLLINLVTDGLPAIALGMEPCESNIMDLPPRKNRTLCRSIDVSRNTVSKTEESPDT